ncbi:MAG: GatB/YqeY domain-containing protein [Rhodospirillaceae bacterium]|nr:GatB/YqeY domain-containing protein [Rhodospirillaceae bacterium]
MLRTVLNEAMKDAMRSKDAAGLSTIRLILAALKDRDIAARSKGNYDGISEDEILQMFNGMIKQRRESITLYEQGGRCELAQKENEEIAVIQRFMPKQMDDAEVDAAVKAAIAGIEAKGLKDMGRVMAVLKEKHAGQMDFTKASALVKQALS